AAFVVAVSFDLGGYENFLLLIGGVFVSLFGVLLADDFVARRQHYDTDELHASGGRYWFWGGFSPAGLLAWFAGFAVYAVAAQPPGLVSQASWITNAPE